MKNLTAQASVTAFAAACTMLFSILASGCNERISNPGTVEHKISTDDAGTVERKVITGKTGTTEYRCVENSSGECAYLLYTKDCQPGSSPEGRERFVCTYEVIDQFTLAEGKSKVIETNGREIKECIGTGAIPKLTECLK